MATYTINPDRLNRLFGEDFHFRHGSGDGINDKVDACIMQAVDWLAGGDGSTDTPECAAPCIARFCIRLNDSPLFENHRDLLKPFAPKIVGTREGRKDRTQAYIAADYAVRVFAPIWLRADPQKRFDEWAEKMESLPRIKDKASAKAGEKLADSADSAASAAYADSAAYAASADYAASAAYAASADSAAYADSVDYADYADSVDYAAYTDSAFRRKLFAEQGDLLRAKMLECLQAMIDA